MKRNLFLAAMGLMAMTSVAVAQPTESFNFTGNIGGDCIDASCNNNGWYTHDNSKVTTINVEEGSLTYPGIWSGGNKVRLTGVTTEVTRDVNKAVTIVGVVTYYSALVNIIDATNLADGGYNYFMHLGDFAGNTKAGYFARLGVKSNAGKVNFGILNTGGGTSATSFTAFPGDFNFGETHLIVVKYDKSTNTATLWVNPTLGAGEPAGGVTNNTGTSAAPASIMSICIRNGYDSTGAVGTPNAYIDEIRVKTSFNAVSSVESVNSNFSVYPNPVQSELNITSDEMMSNVKLVNVIGQTVVAKNVNAKQTTVNTASLTNGVYFVRIQDNAGNTAVTKILKN
jgi:hypothetical protein